MNDLQTPTSEKQEERIKGLAGENSHRRASEALARIMLANIEGAYGDLDSFLEEFAHRPEKSLSFLADAALAANGRGGT